MPNSNSDESVLEHDGKTGADYSDADTGSTKAIPPSERPDPTGEHESAGAFSEAMKGQQVEVRDPAEETDLDDWTPNQVEQWRHMKKRERQYFEDLEAFEQGEIEGTDVRKPLLGDLGGVGSGKAQPLDSPVLTPDGWTTMREIEPGDRVIGSDGQPTTVTATHPQGETDVYRVVFNDGSEVLCNPEHLWSVQTPKDRYRGYGFRTKTAEQIKQDIEGGADTTAAARRRFVPKTDPVEFSKSDLPLNPYVTGALLGDGMIHSGAVRLSSGDPKIPRNVDERLRDAEVRNIKDGEYSICSKTDGSNPVKEKLKACGVYGTHSGEKFIPDDYLYGSVRQRLGLLRGLMDTDGTVTDVGTASFSTVSRRLANNVRDLVRSLGGRTKVRRRKTNGGRGYAYRVRVNIDANPFALERKRSDYNTDAKQGRTKKIERIEEAKPRRTKCITVADSNHEYVTKGYTVTHNSYTGAALMAPRQVQVYDGSIGLFCANTREQTERSLIPRFKKGMAALGYSWEKATYHKSIIFRGEVYKHTIAIEVAKNTYSFIRVGSFANADRLESEEFDWGVLSEIQSADEHAVKKVRRRIRGTAANALVYAEGTPRKQGHWQYDDNRGLRSMGFKVWMSDTRDNPHKQPGYASELRSMYGAARADAMVAGHPIKESTDAVFYNFDREKHANSEAAHDLTEYDPNRKLIIFIDFNLSPMSIGVFQPKDASGWDGFKDEVLAQVDEFEVWQGGTRQAMREIRKKYREHTAGAFISGDGTETKDTTSPDETDWDIVKSELADHLHAATVQPGTYQPEDSDKWSNPPVRDRINAGNWLLNDGLGRSRCVFLPDSEYDSGGLMESVAQVEKDNEGKINKSIDKTTDRDATQSHFADVWSYMAYDRMRKEGYIGQKKAVDEAMEQLAKMASSDGNGFGGGGERGSFTSF